MRRYSKDGTEIKCFFGEGESRHADEKVCGALYYFAAGGGIIQHSGSDFHRKRQLSGIYGNAANTVVFPLTVVALAVAVMIGDGCCAFVSISLGADEKENAHRSIGSAVVLCILASVLLTALYFLFRDPILTMFGGRVNDETFRYSKEYFIYISMGIPFYMFGQAMNPIIRSDGSPRFAMISTLAGAVIRLYWIRCLFSFSGGE